MFWALVMNPKFCNRDGTFVAGFHNANHVSTFIYIYIARLLAVLFPLSGFPMSFDILFSVLVLRSLNFDTELSNRVIQ